MAAGSGNSAAGALTQFSEASKSFIDEQDNKLTIPLVLFYLPQPARCQQVKYGMEIVAVPQL